MQSVWKMSTKNYPKLSKNIKTDVCVVGGIFLVDGKKKGVYKDEDGNLHKVKSKCAHMNCDLNFNKHTTTFDCVCHGSRYNVLGEPLNSPTINDIKID